jgi:hypothetical protein
MEFEFRTKIAYVLGITKDVLTKYLAPMLIALVATAINAGCGGSNGSDGDSSSSGSPASTYEVVASTTVATAAYPEDQLVPRIERICRKAWPVVIDNFVKYRSWQDSKESSRKLFAKSARLSLMAGIDFHIFDEIYQLGAPRGEERGIEEMIGSMQLAVELAQKGLEPVSTVPRIARLFADYNERAESYGLDECLVDEARLGRLEAR